MIDSLRRELVYAARSLGRAAGFSITPILILALGIGMTSAIFTVFRSVLVERMPVRGEDRIVELSGVGRGAASELPLDAAQYRRFRDHAQTLESVAAMAHWRVIADAFEDNNRPVILRVTVVTENFFQVLGAAPALGRLFRTQGTPLRAAEARRPSAPSLRGARRGQRCGVLHRGRRAWPRGDRVQTGATLAVSSGAYRGEMKHCWAYSRR